MKRWMAAAAVTVLASGCGGDSGGDREAPAAPSYYLSLGDSLTVGVQPDENGEPRETSEGYTDVLYRTLYDSDSTLRHERMGCGGEDTTTFLEGGLPRCEERYDGASQLEAAEAFLAEHEGAVELVTLTIGGNNFTRCVTGAAGGGAGIDEGCVADGLDRLGAEVPVIAERLREAAGPDTQIVGMTYYNPFLALLLLEGGPAEEAAGEGSGGTGAEPTGGAALAARSAEVLTQLNESLVAAYSAAGIDVADVDAVFEPANDQVPADSGTGTPVHVQRVCALTWMCDLTRGPDIHTNAAGAREIAGVFADQVR